jgi:hypothetical protein
MFLFHIIWLPGKINKDFHCSYEYESNNPSRVSFNAQFADEFSRSIKDLDLFLNTRARDAAGRLHKCVVSIFLCRSHLKSEKILNSKFDKFGKN